MIPLSTAISGKLTWSKIPRSRGYELKLDNQVVGTLRRSGFLSASFQAETQEGRWTFRRAGCLGGAQIVDSASQQRIATLKSNWRGGGALTFADGQRFHLQSKGWWRPTWSVISDDGQPVLQAHSREKTVQVPGVVEPRERLSLLILFTWYRKLQAEEDAASAATVAVIAAS